MCGKFDLKAKMSDTASTNALRMLEYLRQNALTRETHRYSRKIVTGKRCNYCHKILYFVALRCKGCRRFFHRHCAGHVSSRCVLAISKDYKDNHMSEDLKASLERLSRLSEDRRVPVNGENAEEFRVRKISAPSPATLVHSEPSTSSYVSQRPVNLSLSVPTGIACSDSCRGSQPDFELLSPNSDNVFCESNMTFDLDPDHSNHSSLSHGYCSASGSDSVGCHEDDVTTPVSRDRRSKMTQASRRTNWLTSPFRGQTFDSAKGSTEVVEPRSPRSSRIATWPLDPYCHPRQSESDDVIVEDTTDHDEWLGEKEEENNASANISEARERLKEWTIDHNAFKFGEIWKKGKDSDIYRGNWHGEVLIHTRKNVTNTEAFLDEVATLSMIRHENVTLFMGTCIDPPNLAIITSIHKGPSLFDKLHIQGAKIPISSKARIVRQVTQAMSYLHAKGILVPHLSSRAVYLESKVKLCMMGEASEIEGAVESETVRLQKGEVTYLPPEILQTARVTPPSLCYDVKRTKAADVYAFGTIIYELLTGRFPFRKESLESIFYKVCKGQRATMPEDIRCPPSLKRIHKECWSQLPENRPTFSLILSQLSQNVAMVHRRHSFSETNRSPHKINRPW